MTKKKIVSFSVSPENKEFAENTWETVKGRYSSKSHWANELFTHLRTKDNKKSKAPKAPVKRFKPPTVEEVRIHCNERNNGIDAETFMAHYKTNGWVQGKNKPVKDWKACVITWEKKNKNNSSQPSLDEKLNDTSWADNFDDIV